LREPGQVHGYACHMGSDLDLAMRQCPTRFT
jgi:hypothetical protein